MNLVLGALMVALCLSINGLHADITLTLPLTIMNQQASSSSTWESIRGAVEKDSGIGSNNMMMTNAYTNVQSGVQYQVGQFVAKVSVGTQNQKAMLSIDMASSLTWVQCARCSQRSCFPQVLPPYDPTKSRTNRIVSCADPMCAKTSPGFCSAKPASTQCGYSIDYMDGSGSSGSIMRDSINVGQESVRDFYMGCGTDNMGSTIKGFSGVLGLGKGPSNLAWRMGGSFCYELPAYLDPVSKGSLCLGPRCKFPRRGVVTMKIQPTPFQSDMYALGLSGFSVGGQFVSVAAGTSTVINTGTFISRLVQPAYEAFKVQFMSKVRADVKRAPRQNILDTCFCVELENVQNGMFPTVALDFGHLGQVQLPVTSTLAAMGPGIVCFAFAPASPSQQINIIGSFTQQRISVGVNLRAETISFAP